MATDDQQGQGPVSVERYREALIQLLDGWQEQTTVSVHVPPEQLKVMALVYPWVTQAHRFGQAYLLLEEHGLVHETYVVVRSALEHALMAHWVAVTGDAAVVARYTEDTRNLVAMVTEAESFERDGTSPTWDTERLKEAIEDRGIGVVDEQRVQLKIAQICERLGLRNSIYPAYRVMSRYSHPTTLGAEVYLETTDGGTLVMRNEPNSPAGEAGVSMMAHCVYWARRVLDDLTVGKPHEGWLDGIADSIQVVRRLPQPRP